MNCRDITNLLAEGKPLDKSALSHIAACPACQHLLSAKFLQEEPLHQNTLDRVKRIATTGLRPVRPLPSDRQLTFLLLGLFLSFIFFAALSAGTRGFRSLEWWQACLYYGAILVGALFAASAVVQEIAPGARRYFDGPRLLVIECAVLLILVAILFHNLQTAYFMAGTACLKFGSECAAVSAVLFAFVMRDGFFVSPVRTGVITGFFAGLAGVGVLAIHCGLLTIPHIWTWHLGVLPLSMAAGAGVGFFIQKISLLRNLRDHSVETR